MAIASIVCLIDRSGGAIGRGREGCMRSGALLGAEFRCEDEKGDLVFLLPK